MCCGDEVDATNLLVPMFFKGRKGEMTPDEFKQAKFIVETHRGIHEERKKKEFKIVLTTLTFYAASVAAVLSKRFTLDCPKLVFFISTFLVLAGAASVYFSSSAGANEVNLKKLAQPAEDLILKSLNIDPPKCNPMRWMWVWQAVVIWAGAILASVFVLG
jgi:hypothetical protein